MILSCPVKNQISYIKPFISNLFIIVIIIIATMKSRQLQYTQIFFLIFPSFIICPGLQKDMHIKVEYLLQKKFRIWKHIFV
jgi:hypothetical protein